MATYEQLMNAARKADAGGNAGDAKRLVQMAVAAKGQAAPEKSMGQKVKEFFVGDDDPTTQNLGEKIGTALNKAGESMTFGLVGDEASAALESAASGVSYDDRLKHYRQQEALLEKSNPGVALGADVGGALVGAMGPLGALGALGKGAGLGARAAASAAVGAGMGGTYGFMEGEGAQGRANDAMTGAALGGAVGAAAPVVGAGAQKVADALRRSRANSALVKSAPTTGQLRGQAHELYNQVDQAGVQVKPQALQGARSNILNALRSNTGFDELPGPGSLTPQSARAMQIMGQAGDQAAQAPTAAIPFRSLDQMRRQAGAAAGNYSNRADMQAGREIVGGLDDFIANLGPSDVVAGDVGALQNAIPRAREMWARMSKSGMIDEAIKKGESGYMSGGSSGIRNQFAKILRNDRLKSKFNAEEIRAMEKVVKGSIPETILNYMGSGLGMMAQIGGGAATGGVGGGIMGAGTATLSRKGSEAVARRNAEIARALIASGGSANLPVSTDSTRRLIEALTRRGGVAVQQ